MNTLNHLGMAAAIKDAVKKELGINLDTVSFMYGNIKPDISSYLINIPHFKKDAMGFIISEIRQLMAYKIDKNTGCTKHFSERLGIVTHYLSDFFCHAHSESFKGSLLSHYLYEANLHRYFKRNIAAVKGFRFSRYLRCNPEYKSVCNLINKLYDKYNTRRPSYAHDITYALRVCITVAVTIIGACMYERLDIAA